MKRFFALALLGSLAAGQSALADSSMSLHSFTPKVLPVLVNVDSHGKVTEVSPSMELTPRYDRLLRQSLDHMINEPAKEHGQPVPSQFVIYLGLQTSPREDGNYDARFVYVSTSPVPSGSWYWDHIDGHRLALRNRLDVGPRRNMWQRATPPRPNYQYQQRRSPTMSSPSIQRASRSASQMVQGR